MTSANYCLRRAEITEESTSVGGWQGVQEYGDCVGRYFWLKKDMKELVHKVNLREVSLSMMLSMPGS